MPPGFLPPHGQAGRGFGSQDARNANTNRFAIQPSATPTKVNLKRPAVKVVSRAPATPSASPAAKQVPSTATKKAEDPFVPPSTSKPPQNGASASSDQLVVDMLKMKALSQSPRPSVDAPKPDMPEMEDLDAHFARLMSESPAPAITQSSTMGMEKANTANQIESDYVMLPRHGDSADKPVIMSFDLEELRAALDENSKEEAPPATVKSHVVKPEGIAIAEATKPTTEKIKTERKPDEFKNGTPDNNAGADAAAAAAAAAKDDTVAVEDPSKQELEQRYLKEGLEYLHSLSSVTENNDVHLVSTVSTKLQVVVNPDTDLGVSDIYDLKFAFVEAVAKFLNGLNKGNSPNGVDTKWLMQVLADDDGNFLSFCAKLVERELISIDKLDDLVGLCNAITDVLPKENADQDTTVMKNFEEKVNIQHGGEELPKENKPINVKQEEKQSETKKATSTAWVDPAAKLTAWPTQEKRDNIAGCRTAILRGVSPKATIHDIQALVWGGRVEAILPPSDGMGYAMIKFVTAEGCQKFFDATENGIVLPLALKKEWKENAKGIVYVERSGTPDSVNDMLQIAIDQGYTRCVRALDADEDWSPIALNKIAKGNGKMPREVDCIKQGMAGSRQYIEFRFATIYQALTFMREIRTEEDWEACFLKYAEDPCTYARGVHVSDDEEEAQNA